MGLMRGLALEGPGNSRHGSKEKRSQLLRLQSSMMKSAAQRLFAQLLRDLNPYIIRLAPGFDLVILLRRHGQIASLHGHIAVQALEHAWIFKSVAPIFLQFFEQEFLGVIMLRKGAG